jgi:molybdopterin-guanine dinucleotide biosynthesis protein B
MPHKTVSVIGFKNSGKTSVVETLVKELSSRGYSVGTLKHTTDDIILDTPGKDTSRHREAGSKATAILHENTTAIFIDKHLTLQQAAAKLGEIDYLIIEGFKTINTHPRIIVPRENNELKELCNGLEIAIVKIPESKYDLKTDTHILELTQSKELGDIVESKAFPMLSELDCKTCGYPDCKSMGIALLAGEANIAQCVGYSTTFNLKVNGVDVPLNKFTRRVMENVVLGFIMTLKGGEEAKKIKLEFTQE